LRRDGNDLSLRVEHRAAPSMPPITIELAQHGTAPALEVVDRHDPATPPSTSGRSNLACCATPTRWKRAKSGGVRQ
jgi:hypothetical protein